MIKPKKPKKIMNLYQSEAIKSLCPMLSRYDNQGLMIDTVFNHRIVSWSKYLDDLCYQIFKFKVRKQHHTLLISILRDYGVSLVFEKRKRLESKNGKVILIKTG